MSIIEVIRNNSKIYIALIGASQINCGRRVMTATRAKQFEKYLKHFYRPQGSHSVANLGDFHSQEVARGSVMTDPGGGSGRGAGPLTEQETFGK